MKQLKKESAMELRKVFPAWKTLDDIHLEKLWQEKESFSPDTFQNIRVTVINNYQKNHPNYTDDPDLLELRDQFCRVCEAPCPDGKNCAPINSMLEEMKGGTK